MKRTLNLIPLVLLCGMLLTGFTPKKAVTDPNSVVTDVELYIQLPWSGIYNDWIITFKSRDTGEWYELITDDSMWPDGGILGTIPAGNYDIEFNSGYSRGFEFGVDAPDFYHWRFGDNYFNWYNVPITGDATIMIHQGT